MVELKVNVHNGEGLGSECFLAVRVGETQKLSRLSASRSYKFPASGERRYGKIELYRRVGACSVDIDPQKEGARSVAMKCGDLGQLLLDVDVGGAGAPEPEKPKMDNDERAAKSRAASEYLRKYSVEMQLTDAMQALLKTKPG
mmetsp:Transcript_62596/g.174943  ORF Transcript_62596/g.174943 Transcript_62596/m.174943 type:complete len:143 (+) Transcript_62596:61-489(+)